MVVDTSVKYICLLNWMLNHIRTATQSDYLVVLGQHLAVSPKLFNAPDGHTLWMTISMVMFGCFLAFMISVSEFLLLSHTSSLTLSISGIFKVSSNSHDYNSYKTVFKYVLCPFSRKANPLTRSCLDPYMSHLFYFSFWTLFDIYCFPNWSPVGPGGGGGVLPVMAYMGRSWETFYFCDWSMIYSSWKGCKVLNKVCERGTVCQ